MHRFLPPSTSFAQKKENTAKDTFHQKENHKKEYETYKKTQSATYIDDRNKKKKESSK